MKYNPFERCDRECRSERCDDYGTDYCADWHTEDEHFKPGHGFCAKMAWFSHGCEICQEYLAIWLELKDGEIPKRICHECHYLFELDYANPYGEILYDEGTGAVYFECDECCLLEGDMFEDDGSDEDYSEYQQIWDAFDPNERRWDS